MIDFGEDLVKDDSWKVRKAALKIIHDLLIY